MSVVMELVKNVLNTPFEAFDASVVEKARNRIIDVVGCIIGGANAPGNSAILDLVKEWGGKRESTVLVHGGAIPAHNAVLVNCAMSRSYDFEPAGPLVEGRSTPAHVSGTTVPTALAVAEKTNAGGKDLLAALILGDDIAARIIAASNLNIDSGFDCTGTVNAFGAAAIAARLLGLTEHETVNAFGIALNQFAGTFQNVFDGTHSFKLPQGLSARAGVFSAALARKGFTGVRDPLLSRYGYFALYCKSYQLDVLTKNLGTEYYADNTCKPYSCCRSNHAAIDCVLRLLQTHIIHPEDVDEIVVDVTPTARDFAVGQPFQIRDVPQIDAAFNLQYNVANVLLRKCHKLEHFTDEYVRDPRIMEIVSRVRLTTTVQPEKPLGAGVRIKTKQGGEFEARIDMPRGNDVLTPLALSEKRTKFFDNVRFSNTIRLEKAERAFSLLEKLEEVDDVRTVIEHLVM